MATPGSKREWEPGDENELDARGANMYRTLVARGNCMAQGRTDVQFAVKELCRSMPCPTAGGLGSTQETGEILGRQDPGENEVPVPGASKEVGRMGGY